MSQDIGSYDIKKRPVLANRTKYTRCTTYYCILTYEFPLTVENRADLLARGFPGRSDASLGVIFHLHPAPGFHHPRLALAFPQIYCLRHRFFLCVTPLYYKDSAKKCQDFPQVPDKIPGFFPYIRIVPPYACYFYNDLLVIPPFYAIIHLKLEGVPKAWNPRFCSVPLPSWTVLYSAPRQTAASQARPPDAPSFTPAIHKEKVL